METFVYEIDIVDLIYDNSDSVGLPAELKKFKPDFVRKTLGEADTFTVEVPVVDTAVFAVESYIYSLLEFSVKYGNLIYNLYDINPDATVVLLGATNPFDMDLEIGGNEINVGEAYAYVAQATSVQPFAYALVSPNVGYADISDAQTKFEEYVEEGVVTNSALDFITLYLADSSILDISDAGNMYVAEQIVNSITPDKCIHAYSSDCDERCDKCGDIRATSVGHSYGAGEVIKPADYGVAGEMKYVCKHCGDVMITAIDPIPVPHEHTYADEWVSDETYHWHAATCGHDVVDGKAEHSYVVGGCE